MKRQNQQISSLQDKLPALLLLMVLELLVDQRLQSVFLLLLSFLYTPRLIAWNICLLIHNPLLLLLWRAFLWLLLFLLFWLQFLPALILAGFHQIRNRVANCEP